MGAGLSSTSILISTSVVTWICIFLSIDNLLWRDSTPGSSSIAAYDAIEEVIDCPELARWNLSGTKVLYSFLRNCRVVPKHIRRNKPATHPGIKAARVPLALLAVKSGSAVRESDMSM